MAAKFRIDREGPVARLVLSNPDKHNCFDDSLIADLTAALDALGADADVRVVVLSAEGRSFSAGADLNWMQRMAGNTDAENVSDARALTRLMRTLDALPKPTIALVQGPAFGGGVGLVSCCDIAIASAAALFSLSEVRLGIIPAAIAPYVISAIGARAARRYFLSAERFDAAEALRLGLVHKVVAPEALAAEGAEMAATLLRNGPQAIREAKDLIARIAGPVDEALMEETAQRIARVRATPEGREGVAAFLEKREPGWIVDETE